MSITLQNISNLCQKYGISQASIKGDSEWDSITHLMMCSELCELLNVELTPEFLEAISSYEDLQNLELNR
jgi:acyl carrier protein